MAICDLDVAPAFERSKHHEEIGGAIALVLIIQTGRASPFHRDRHARFRNELLSGLLWANQPAIALAWARIDGQHVFHSGYERAVGLRRDDPVLAAMGLKSVFLSARPIVLSLARSTMPSSTTLFSNNRKVQRARPLGGLEQAKAISLASLSPSKIRATAGIAARLIGQWLSERLGQSFVVENRPGAGSNIATESVVRAPADGYTLLLTSLANAANATLYDKLGYDFIRDVAPVAAL